MKAAFDTAIATPNVAAAGPDAAQSVLFSFAYGTLSLIWQQRDHFIHCFLLTFRSFHSLRVALTWQWRDGKVYWIAGLGSLVAGAGVAAGGEGAAAGPLRRIISPDFLSAVTSSPLSSSLIPSLAISQPEQMALQWVS